jgi:hypothetical protein
MDRSLGIEPPSIQWHGVAKSVHINRCLDGRCIRDARPRGDRLMIAMADQIPNGSSNDQSHDSRGHLDRAKGTEQCHVAAFSLSDETLST